LIPPASWIRQGGDSSIGLSFVNYCDSLENGSARISHVPLFQSTQCLRCTMKGKREFLKEFDIFSKVDKSAVPSSTTGGTFSFIVISIVLFLFVQEFISFGASEFNEYVSVDKSGNGVMDLAMDISFPHLSCSGSRQIEFLLHLISKYLYFSIFTRCRVIFSFLSCF
jgi:hypothetical protein